MKTELLRKVDRLIMEVWNDNETDNETKNECVKKLQEVQMILQGEKL